MRTVTRKLYIATGAIATSLGIIGIFVPLMPTTCFILVAAWAFAKSSPAAYERLINHPHLGPRIRDWQQHRIISRKSKRVASISIIASVALSMLLLKDSLIALLILGCVMCGLLWFINSRPSELPDDSQELSHSHNISS